VSEESPGMQSQAPNRAPIAQESDPWCDAVSDTLAFVRELRPAAVITRSATQYLEVIRLDFYAAPLTPDAWAGVAYKLTTILPSWLPEHVEWRWEDGIHVCAATLIRKRGIPGPPRDTVYV
jgi:hypothetical protein